MGDIDGGDMPFSDPMFFGLGRANSAPDIGDACCCEAIVVDNGICW